MARISKIAAGVVESAKRIDPEALASVVVNLRQMADGSLRALAGIAPLIPDYGEGYPTLAGRVWGVHHTLGLWGGTQNTTLARAGGTLYKQAGWDRTWEAVVTDLYDGPGQYPDLFVDVGGRVVWSNGVDRAILFDGEVALPLGYSRAPEAPLARGPAPLSPGRDTKDNPAIYRNQGGYAHPGAIGTPSDMLSGQAGGIRAGAWYYWQAWEDAFGNLSPLSAASNPVTLRAEQSADFYTDSFAVWDRTKPLQQYAVGIDDLTKQFLVVTGTNVPVGTVATWLYRSQDTYSNPNKPLFLARLEGAGGATTYPDNQTDAQLGPEAGAYLAVPVFRCACAHNGALVMANTPEEPGVLLKSLPGVVGTIPQKNTCYPDANCAEVMAVQSAFGRLFAFTRDRLYEVKDTDWGLASELVAAVGCVGPGTITATPFGLVWLGRSSVYVWDGQSGPVDVSEDERPRIQALDPARVRYAVACYDADYQEWLCAVTMPGEHKNTTVLVYNGTGFRRYKLGVPVYSMCFTRDHRGYVLFGSRDDADRDMVFVLDAQTLGYGYSILPVAFTSRWLQADVTGQQEFNLDSVRIGFIGSSTQALTMRVYKNGSWAEEAEDAKVLLPCAAPTTDLAGTVAGETPIHASQLVWRKVDVFMRGLRSVAFKILGETGQKVAILAFMFDLRVVDPDATRTKRGSAT